jgi:membrane-bound ClpP family serine protease
MKLLGFFLIFLTCYHFEQGYFTLKDIAIFLIGLLLVCGKPMFEHLFFIEREKVRAQYRSRR